MTSFIDFKGNEIIHTYCHCLVPDEELDDKNVCKYKVNCKDSEESEDCHGNGKCVQLPGVVGKSCLCKIEWAGEFCQKRRTCLNGQDDFQRLCLNGGQCNKKGGDSDEFECDCGDEFFGEHCEKIHPCHHLKVILISLLGFEIIFLYKYIIKLLQYI